MARRKSIAATLLTLAVSATGLSPAAGTTSHRLTAHQIHRIVKMTGYHGLRSHRFDLATAFRAGGANTVVVRLDRAKLGVRLHELRADIGLATKLAAGRPAFTTTIKLGSGPARRITFDVAPAGVLAPNAPYVRYFIFTRHSEQLTDLTRPQRVPAIQALTVIDAAHRINVTLLQDSARGDTWGPDIPAAQLFTMIESLNTSSYVYVTPKSADRLAKHHLNSKQLVALGREVWSNSLGFAIVAARKGTPYDTYAREASQMRFHIYERNHLRYLTVSAAEYRRFARS